MPQEPSAFELLFPVKGQSRKLGYQQQPPSTTYDCSNVWPRGPIESRGRGGSRPGTSKAYSELLGIGQPIQFLQSVTVVGSDATTSDALLAASDGVLYYRDSSGAFVPILSSDMALNGDFETHTGDNFADWTESGPQVTAETTIFHGGAVCAKLAGTGAPSGVILWQAWTAKSYDHFRLVFWTRGDGTAQISYMIYSSDPAYVEFGGGVTASGVTGTTWTKITKDVKATAGINNVKVAFYQDPPTGAAYVDDVEFYLMADKVNDTAETLQAAPLHQKLYIANYRPTRIYSSDGIIAATNQLSDSVSNPDWTTLDIDTDLDVALITFPGAATTADDDVYDISSVAAGYIVVSGTLPNSACTYEIGRKVKVYDPSDNTVSVISATYGIPPINCTLACTYRDRLVLAQGNTWYMSRMDDPTDWDYAYDPVDPMRPVAGSNNDAGLVGQPITALMPHADDYLVFGCENQLWVLRGDPASGGQLDSASREVGVVSSGAWCAMPDASIVFLSRQGLYWLQPMAGSFPQPISRDVLPEEFLDTDVSSNVVSMEYDGQYRGIHIFITPTDGSTGSHWFLDWETKGFFPVTSPDAMQPQCLHPYAVTPGVARVVLMGGRDGYVRQYDRTATDDDGSGYTSYVKLGPLRLAPLGYDGSVTELASVFAASSQDVGWGLMVGDTEEEAVTSTTVIESGTWSGGLNPRTAPRARAGVVSIKIAATAKKWAMESVFGLVQPGGRQR